MEDAMTDLGPQARALLDAARDGDEPTPENRARVLAAVSAKLVLGAAAAGATTAAAKSTAAAAG
jgi:hypothetical protein